MILGAYLAVAALAMLVFVVSCYKEADGRAWIVALIFSLGWPLIALAGMLMSPFLMVQAIRQDQREVRELRARAAKFRCH